MTLPDLCEILELPDMVSNAVKEIISVDYESLAALDWVYPGGKGIV